MNIYFDVGANDGSSSNRWVANGLVYAFEPNPFFTAALAKRQNTKLFQVAVSDYTGQATFNVCERADRGCSSLLELSEIGKTQWGGRTDMFPSTTINVDVIRLDSLDWTQIPEVEFLHCDAQGSDLAVLKGLGVYLQRIRAGVVEVASRPDVLYVGQNTECDTVAYLEANGFKVDQRISNDGNRNEYNIHFSRI